MREEVSNCWVLEEGLDVFCCFMTQGLGVVLVMGEGCGLLGFRREGFTWEEVHGLTVGGDGLVGFGRRERG